MTTAVGGEEGKDEAFVAEMAAAAAFLSAASFPSLIPFRSFLQLLLYPILSFNDIDTRLTNNRCPISLCEAFFNIGSCHGL